MFWSSTEALLYPSPPKSWEVALWMKPAEERPSQSFLGSGLLCPTSPNLPNAAKATPKTVHRMRYPKRTPFAVRGCLDQGQLACFVSLTEKVPAPETSMVPCDRRPQGERGEGQVPSGGRDSRKTQAGCCNLVFMRSGLTSTYFRSSFQEEDHLAVYCVWEHIYSYCSHWH